MKPSTRYGLAGIGGLALLSFVHWARGATGDLPEAANALLGVLPNVAAAIAIPFVLLGMVADSKKSATPAEIRRWFHGLLLFSVMGLIGWEIIQRTSANLVYDNADIAATIAGAVLSAIIFAILSPSRASG